MGYCADPHAQAQKATLESRLQTVSEERLSNGGSVELQPCYVVFTITICGDREEEVPTHPAFKLVANSEQILSSRYSRRLITMEKVAPYDEVAAQAHLKARGGYQLAIDNVHALVYEARPEQNGLDQPASERLSNRVKYRGKQI